MYMFLCMYVFVIYVYIRTLYYTGNLLSMPSQYICACLPLAIPADAARRRGGARGSPSELLPPHGEEGLASTWYVLAPSTGDFNC